MVEHPPEPPCAHGPSLLAARLVLDSFAPARHTSITHLTRQRGGGRDRWYAYFGLYYRDKKQTF